MKKIKGFTLIEVLVASFILFMVVSASSGIFYSAVKSKINAEGYVLSTTYAPLLADHIDLQLQRGATSGSGHFMGVEYTWSARSLKSSAVKSYAPAGMDTTGAGELAGMAILWQVNLSIRSKFRNQDFSFKSTSWVAS